MRSCNLSESLLESECLDLSFSTSFQDLSTGQGKVISDMDLIGGRGPEAPTSRTTAAFGAAQSGKDIHELGPSFLSLSPDTAQLALRYEDSEYADKHTYISPEPEVHTTSEVPSIVS